MLRPYRDLFARPGAVAFSAAALIARVPMATVGIAIVLVVSARYGSDGLAGRVSAALVVTVPFAFLLETFHVELGWQFFAVLAWSVLGTSVAAILLLLYLLSHGQVSRVASLVYLVPPLAALQAFVFLGEALTALTIAGTAIVVAGVYLANYKGREPAAAPPPPAQ